MAVDARGGRPDDRRPPKQYGVKLLAGHTQQLRPPVRAMRKIVQSGASGRCARSSSGRTPTGCCGRARPTSSSSNRAAGSSHRQGPHQIDTLRLLGGGQAAQRARDDRPVDARAPDPRLLHRVHGVRGRHAGDDHAQRLRLLHHRRAVPVGARRRTAISDEDRARASARAMRAGARDEETRERRVPHRRRARPDAARDAERDARRGRRSTSGMLVVSCERGDIRHSKYGLDGVRRRRPREIDLRGFGRQEIDFEGGVTIPALVEMHAAVVLRQAGLPQRRVGPRDARGVAGADHARRSERREIMLERQVAMPAAVRRRPGASRSTSWRTPNKKHLGSAQSIAAQKMLGQESAGSSRWPGVHRLWATLCISQRTAANATYLVSQDGIAAHKRTNAANT